MPPEAPGRPLEWASGGIAPEDQLNGLPGASRGLSGGIPLNGPGGDAGFAACRYSPSAGAKRGVD